MSAENQSKIAIKDLDSVEEASHISTLDSLLQSEGCLKGSLKWLGWIAGTDVAMSLASIGTYEVSRYWIFKETGISLPPASFGHFLYLNLASSIAGGYATRMFIYPTLKNHLIPTLRKNIRRH